MILQKHPHSLFITFEGGEGSGKSTQIKKLSDDLTRLDIPHIMTREPGGCPEAECLRNLIVNHSELDWDAVTELLIMIAARAEHWKKVISGALQKGYWVLCDRFVDSTLAYQGYGRAILPTQTILSLHTLLLAENFFPDITFFLDLPPQEGLKRAAQRGLKYERFERETQTFHERVYTGYLDLCRHYPRIKRIDAQRTPEAVFLDIQKHLESFKFAVKKGS